MNWPNWWQWNNSLYKIYPSSYSDKLINLCWYWWGGGLYPYRLILSSSLSKILTASLQPRALVFIRTWSDMLLHQYLVASKTNPFRLRYLYQLKRNLFHYFIFCLQDSLYTHEWIIAIINKEIVLWRDFPQICVERTQVGCSESYHT